MPTFSPSPLTPTAFLTRSARVFPERTAVLDGEEELTWRQLDERSRRLAGALVARGVRPGGRVAVLCSNSTTMLELHHAVPWAGAVLVPLNVRLTTEELAWILDHSGAGLLVADAAMSEEADAVSGVSGIGLLADGDGTYAEERDAAEPLALPCEDEDGLLALNYTSGTTGRPKGVMYGHRGAYLQSLAMAHHTRLGPESRYLWTLPMFHCNGWCFPWAVTAAGATHVCLPRVDPERIWHHLRADGITHLSAAPTVLTSIASAADAAPVGRPVHVQTGGAPPSPSLLSRLAALDLEVTHLYGLTETYGPLAVNQWHPEWDDLPEEERAALQARQGVGNVVAERLRVVAVDGGDGGGGDVPDDGETLGEIVARGNDVMLGYYRDDEATAAATWTDPADGRGWFRTGDLAVVHPDGYVEIRDRSKDVIISGGENISSVEVERVLDSHPDVLESAVVAVPHDWWGEVPLAHVTLRDGAEVSDEELEAYARERLAAYKVPRRYVRGELPRTSTGKIRKNVLRERARE